MYLGCPNLFSDMTSKHLRNKHHDLPSSLRKNSRCFPSLFIFPLYHQQALVTLCTFKTSPEHLYFSSAPYSTLKLRYNHLLTGLPRKAPQIIFLSSFLLPHSSSIHGKLPTQFPFSFFLTIETLILIGEQCIQLKERFLASLKPRRDYDTDPDKKKQKQVTEWDFLESSLKRANSAGMHLILFPF